MLFDLNKTNLAIAEAVEELCEAMQSERSAAREALEALKAHYEESLRTSPQTEEAIVTVLANFADSQEKTIRSFFNNQRATETKLLRQIKQRLADTEPVDTDEAERKPHLQIASGAGG
jgi:hypothetical protein